MAGLLSKIAPKAAARRAMYRLQEAQAVEATKMFGGDDRAAETTQVYSASGGGYDAARDSKLRGSAFSRGGRSVDEDHHVGPWARERLRLEGEDLRRNNPIISGGLTRFGGYVVGDVITAKHKTSDEGFNSEADDFWRDYKGLCDFYGRLKLDEICEVIIRSVGIDGDGGAVLLKDGRIAMVEAARIAAGKKAIDRANVRGRVVEGVHVTAQGFKRGYFVAPRKKHGMVDGNAARYVPYWNFIHYARDRFRFDTLRGIGDLAPVINSLKDFAKLHEYTINKAKLDATQGGLLLNPDGGGPGGPILGRNAKDGNNGSEKPLVETVEGIKIHHMRHGDYKSLASNTPNAQYVEFAELILRLIGTGLGVPYEFLTLDFKQGSYQANRTAILTLIKTVQSYHQWLVEDFLAPLQRWRIYKAISDGDIRPAPLDIWGISEWWKVEFSQTPLQFLDPRHDMTAYRDQWNLNEVSLDERARTHGQTRDDRIKEKSKDIEAAMKEAQRLSYEYGFSVSWEQLINANTPGITFTQPTVTE